MPFKIIFMGTPEFSIPSLEKIISDGHEIIGVYTQPPRPGGRGGKVRKTPIHDYAEKAGLKVFTPKSLKSKVEQENFANFGADLAVVVAYGLILPSAILEAPPLGCLNVHGSLLPRWRGAAPIQRAIMAGDKQTGVMIMQMDEGLDTGDILASETISIAENMTAGELHDEMKIKGANLLGSCLSDLEKGEIEKTPQPVEGVTYAEKISKNETEIDWNLPVSEVHNHIRGLSPFPGAWFLAEIGSKKERIKVIKAEISPNIDCKIVVNRNDIQVSCKDGSIKLVKIQRQGKSTVDISSFINGLKGDLRIIQHE